jgi:hypothetical protein
MNLLCKCENAMPHKGLHDLLIKEGVLSMKCCFRHEMLINTCLIKEMRNALLGMKLHISGGVLACE